MQVPYKIGIMGGGSWATAIAKIISMTQTDFNWYMRRPDQIEEFKSLGHNPYYLTGVYFNLDNITFYNDINEHILNSDILIIAIPSPFIKLHLQKLNIPLNDKIIISAIKGIVPDENLLVSDYFSTFYDVPKNSMAVLAGPCHAEEVAMERLSFLNIACTSPELSALLADMFDTHFIKTAISYDVTGIEYASVLKNVYAIVSGICHGLKYGDNFQAILVSNAIVETERFINTICQQPRNICDSTYLGDLLVTAYSRFSRNRIFGTMIGKGYSVKTAQLEMEMIAEGYFGTKCIKEINNQHNVEMPILDTVYSILYEKKPVVPAIRRLTDSFK
jgi:glycerol-3-phosphate dehydrogenase (NAD(P)+)